MSKPDEAGQDVGSALPDIDEMIAVMRETVAAGDAFNELNPSTPKTIGLPGGQRWNEAFQAQRAMLEEIDKAVAEEFGS